MAELPTVTGIAVVVFLVGADGGRLMDASFSRFSTNFRSTQVSKISKGFDRSQSWAPAYYWNLFVHTP